MKSKNERKSLAQKHVTSLYIYIIYEENTLFCTDFFIPNYTLKQIFL